MSNHKKSLGGFIIVTHNFLFELIAAYHGHIKSKVDTIFQLFLILLTNSLKLLHGLGIRIQKSDSYELYSQAKNEGL